MGIVSFCPNCGGLLQVRRNKDTIELYCPKCNYTLDTKNQLLQPTKVEVKRNPKDRTIVVASKRQLATLEEVKGVICPKCGHDKAYFWMMQTRAADEPPTRFYRCIRCNHTWREYA
ncbi:MAG: transcription factor S [Acidilobaceae archaeon]